MTELGKQLYDLMIEKGYPESFSWVVSCEMGTEFVGKRMIGYIRANPLLPEEEVADEMLAILSDRERIVSKHISEHAQQKVNEFYRTWDPDEEE
jgi:hypothetical protein